MFFELLRDNWVITTDYTYYYDNDNFKEDYLDENLLKNEPLVFVDADLINDVKQQVEFITLYNYSSNEVKFLTLEDKNELIIEQDIRYRDKNDNEIVFLPSKKILVISPEEKKYLVDNDLIVLKEYNEEIIKLTKFFLEKQCLSIEYFDIMKDVESFYKNYGLSEKYARFLIKKTNGSLVNKINQYITILNSLEFNKVIVVDNDVFEMIKPKKNTNIAGGMIAEKLTDMDIYLYKTNWVFHSRMIEQAVDTYIKRYSSPEDFIFALCDFVSSLGYSDEFAKRTAKRILDDLLISKK